LLSPVPPAIAAVIPITRRSRFASAMSASANTAVYWGGEGGGGFSSFSGAIAGGESVSLTGSGFLSFGDPAAPGVADEEAAGILFTIEPGFAACHFSIPSRPPSSAAAKPLPFTVWMCTTTGRWAFIAPAIARRSAPTSCPSTTPT
jgi:hypothetical protein